MRLWMLSTLVAAAIAAVTVGTAMIGRHASSPQSLDDEDRLPEAFFVTPIAKEPKTAHPWANRVGAASPK